MFRSLVLLCLALILAACQAAPAPAPTATLLPTSTPQPTATPIPPTTTPVPTPTPFPDSFTSKVEINGNNLNINCKGTGSPTIILESGAGGLSWTGPIFSSISRTCSYVRAGIFNPVSGRRTTLDQVKDLHDLLAQVGVPGPYILVAHSLAAFNLLLYTETYPQEVAGLVCVECLSPLVSLVLIEKLKEYTAKSEAEKNEIEATIKELEKDMAVTSSPESSWRGNSEKLDFAASREQAIKVKSLGDRPLVVLMAGIQPANTFGDVEEQAWKEAQLRISKMSTRGRMEVVENVSHETIVSCEALLKVIQEVYNQVKRP